MGWVKMSDARADHPKLLAAGLAARGLDDAAICWCSSHLTDGLISEGAVAMLAAGYGEKGWRKLVARLVEVGRWEPAEGGWRVHDYLQWQRSRSQVEADRHATNQRVKRHRNAVTDSPSNAVTNEASNGGCNTTQMQKQITDADTEAAAASDVFTNDGCGKPAAAAASPNWETLPARAFAVIAERRITAANGRVDNVEAYRASVLRALPDQLADRLASVDLGEAWTPESLADYLEPPRKPRFDGVGATTTAEGEMFAPGSGRLENWSRY